VNLTDPPCGCQQSVEVWAWVVNYTRSFLGTPEF